VFVGRLLPVVRTYISFPAGLSRMGWVPFLLATAAGCIPWNLALAYAGLLLGRQYGLVEGALGPLVVPAAIGAILLLAVVYGLGRRAGARRANG
jgi:membrane protein DedA with SNARE-associated domain